MIETVSTFTTPTEAYIAKGLLESEGIPAYIADEHYVSAQWTISQAIGGVRLQVPSFFSSQAKKIINEMENGSYEESTFNENIEPTIIHCKRCKSKDIKQVNWIWKLAFVSLFLNLLPIPFSRFRYKCNNCSFSWIDKDQRSNSVVFIFVLASLITVVVMSLFLVLYYWCCRYILCQM